MQREENSERDNGKNRPARVPRFGVADAALRAARQTAGHRAGVRGDGHREQPGAACRSRPARGYDGRGRERPADRGAGRKVGAARGDRRSNQEPDAPDRRQWWRGARGAASAQHPDGAEARRRGEHGADLHAGRLRRRRSDEGVAPRPQRHAVQQQRVGGGGTRAQAVRARAGSDRHGAGLRYRHHQRHRARVRQRGQAWADRRGGGIGHRTATGHRARRPAGLRHLAGDRYRRARPAPGNRRHFHAEGPERSCRRPGHAGHRADLEAAVAHGCRARAHRGRQSGQTGGREFPRRRSEESRAPRRACGADTGRRGARGGRHCAWRKAARKLRRNAGAAGQPAEVRRVTALRARPLQRRHLLLRSHLAAQRAERRRTFKYADAGCA